MPRGRAQPQHSLPSCSRAGQPPTYRKGLKEKRWEIGAAPREHGRQQRYLLVVLVHVAVGEALPAALALVGLVLAVDHLVGAHLVQPLEGLVADLAAVGPFLCGEGVQTPQIDVERRRNRLPSQDSSRERH